MYIVVIGLGEVGRHLVRELAQEGHDLVAIDADEAQIRFVEEHYDVMAIHGYGAREEVLAKAQVGRADLVVAVTDHDEVNLIAALGLLGASAAVLEVVAFGAPSSVYGAVPMAALRLRPDMDAVQELPRLRRLCQDAMGYRAPKALIPVEEIPRGASGKPLRRELARRHALA
jgi:voltage-gated potassium channel Kch